MYEEELKRLQALWESGVFAPHFYSKKIAGGHSFESYEAFREIPFTYKHELRETSAFDRTTTKPGEIYGVFSSSGTTGDKTFYIYNKKDKEVHEEFVKCFYTELGVNATDIGGVLAPVDTGVMAHTMMWQFTTMGAGYVNCPEPSPENIAELIRKIPITIVATRPSIACNVAKNPETAELARTSKVKKLLMGGGFLSKERRKLLEKVWDADCYNMFGMSEMFGPMAGECRQKDGQHYLNQYLMIEILNPVTLEPVAPGEIGVAVYTTLWDKGFPLLRYWTDDLMMVTYEPCPCGSRNPRLYHKGRLADYLLVNGAYVFPEQLEDLLFEHGYFGEYQAIVQKDAAGNLLHVQVLSEQDKIDTVDEALVTKLATLFACETSLKIVPMNSLSYDGHGKRFIDEV